MRGDHTRAEITLALRGLVLGLFARKILSRDNFALTVPSFFSRSTRLPFLPGADLTIK
jgi:hypothetical protein